jgi:hypothetical protein
MGKCGVRPCTCTAGITRTSTSPNTGYSGGLHMGFRIEKPFVEISASLLAPTSKLHSSCPALELRPSKNNTAFRFPLFAFRSPVRIISRITCRWKSRELFCRSTEDSRELSAGSVFCCELRREIKFPCRPNLLPTRYLLDREPHGAIEISL